MTVKELIEMLQKCPQDSIVLYDSENAQRNREARGFGVDECMGIDDCLVCTGTEQGFVLLIEEELAT